MFRQQGLAQARAITGQSLQDDDRIQEYNHMEHLNYLKNLSAATDKLYKKDQDEEDAQLEQSGVIDALSAYGVYGAHQAHLEMADKVSKYLDQLKEQGKTAEDLKAAFAEQGGVGSTIKKAFVSSVAKAKEKINKKMTEHYEDVKDFGHEIGEDVQGVAAQGVTAATEAAQSAKDTAEIFGRQAAEAATTAAQQATSAATSAAQEATASATAAASEAAASVSEAAHQATEKAATSVSEAEKAAREKIRQMPESAFEVDLEDDTGEVTHAPNPFDDLEKEPEIDKFADIEEPPVEGATELKEVSTPGPRPETPAQETTAGPGRPEETFVGDEVDREARDFEQTTREATEDVRSKFAEQMFGSGIKQTKSTHYTDENQAFYTRGDDAVRDYMDSSESIESMENHIANHSAKYGDSFNFRRKFDEGTRLVRDEFWPKGEAAPDLLPNEKVSHAGNVDEGQVNMTQGSREGETAAVGESLPSRRPPPRKSKIPQPFEGESTEPTFSVDQDVEQPSRRPPPRKKKGLLQLEDDETAYLPDPEPEPDKINVGDVAEDPHKDPDFSSSNLKGYLDEEDVEDEPKPTSEPQPQQPPPVEEPEPTEEQTQQARSRRASFIEESEATAGPEPRVEKPSTSPSVEVPDEPPAEHSAGPSAQDLREGLGEAFKSEAEKTAEKTASVFGTAGEVAGKVAAKFGDIMNVGMNVAFAGQATYEEGKDIFSKHSHLEGDGGWEKAGNLIAMVGDDVALGGSLARYAGPEGAIIGTGAELAGGAIALVGGGLDAIGEYVEGEKKKKTAPEEAKKAMPEAPPVQTTAIQNTQGSGGIANVSQSALKRLN